jgi:hypothetical protein
VGPQRRAPFRVVECEAVFVIEANLYIGPRTNTAF